MQITVDQLRGDLPWRHMEQFGSGGFRYLRDKGVWYTDAYFRHANTETIVGHASLATGATPSVHGMVGNVWYDHGAGRLVYNVEDADYSLLSQDADVDQTSEIDPTQRMAKADGRSPRALLSSTFSDELAVRYRGQSKVFAVSIKDRGAIPLAGQAGKAFWFSKAAGEFVTSDYYYRQYPTWVKDWNAAGKVDAYAGRSWGLLAAPESYRFNGLDDSPWETDFPGFGRTFPHPWGALAGKYYTTLLTVSPAGDELTLDFAKTLVDAEGLGQDAVPDYLAISFSSTDYVGHLFGPSSLEMEDNLLRLDRTLASLFAFLDTTVGLKHTLIVLSADHGAPEVPGYLQSLGHQAAYVDREEYNTRSLNALLRDELGVDRDLVRAFFAPYVYLDREQVADSGLDLADVQRQLARELATRDEVFAAYAAADLAVGGVPSDPLARAVALSFQPQRSGDVHLVFASQHFINDFDGLSVAATHGSGWRYDQHVPVVFAGNGLKGRKIARPVTPYDIAVTLSSRLGAMPPSGAVGNVLAEVVD
ncbi:MAG: alkaline phosphatase family protein [Halieaceae bacterium]|nr:alkaline phosphatase family protein [Halieaceae bacterium]